MKTPLDVTALAAVVLAAATGCAPTPAPGNGAGARAPEAEGAAAAAPTNRIAIPEAVRANLGITFARVETRAVAATLRVPGRFEPLPAADWVYHAHDAGRVLAVAAHLSDVSAGDVLFRLESPAWTHELAAVRAARAEAARADARFAALGGLETAQQAAEQAASEARAHWQARAGELERLAESGAGVADALAQARGEAVASNERLAAARYALAELAAERAALAVDRERLLAAASALARAAAARAGLDAASFATQLDGDDPDLLALAVRAVRSGRVTDVTAEVGSWVEAGAHVLSVVDRSAVLLRASVLQSDLGLLVDGAPCRIAAPVVSERSRSIGVGQSIAGRLAVAPVANAHDNTIDVLALPLEAADWARPGVFARLEFEYDATAERVLSVPLSAIQRDGLVPVLFRRNPQDPDQVIRLEADIGLDDGRWIEVKSGVRAGDEVVLDGAFQLLLATSGSMQKGGHFHADGTFHEGED